MHDLASRARWWYAPPPGGRSETSAHLRECGYVVQEECPIGGGKTVDILASKDGRRIAFEIETGKSDVTANIEKATAAGFDKLYVVATSSAAERPIASNVAGCRVAEALSAGAALARSVW